MIRPAASADAFVQNPVGTYVSGEHFLYLCESETAYAFFTWGRAPAQEVGRLLQLLKAELRPEAVGHRVYADLSEVTGVDGEAFSMWRAFTAETAARQAVLTEREALVRPDGLAGAIIAGFFSVYPARFPVRVFASPEEAVRWLQWEPQQLGRWLALKDEVRGVAPLLRELRGWLAAASLPRTVGEAAHHLALSPRSLQRHLKELGVTFHDELDRARFERATALLCDSDTKVAAIAVEVGFAGPQHFDEWFVRRAGLPPAAWRNKKRSA